MLTKSPSVVVYRPARDKPGTAAPAVIRPGAAGDDLHREAMAAADRHEAWFADVKRRLEG